MHVTPFGVTTFWSAEVVAMFPPAAAARSTHTVPAFITAVARSQEEGAEGDDGEGSADGTFEKFEEAAGATLSDDDDI